MLALFKIARKHKQPKCQRSWQQNRRNVKNKIHLLFKDDKPLVPPKRDRVAELPDPPGGGTSITKYVPQVYMGVFRSIFRGSPQLVFADEKNESGE